MDNSSLVHSKLNCKYHIAFSPKYRRKIIYLKIKIYIGGISKKLCEQKGVEIIEVNTCKYQIHMFVSIPPKLSVSQFRGYLRGKVLL